MKCQLRQYFLTIVFSILSLGVFVSCGDEDKCGNDSDCDIVEYCAVEYLSDGGKRRTCDPRPCSHRCEETTICRTDVCTYVQCAVRNDCGENEGCKEHSLGSKSCIPAECTGNYQCDNFGTNMVCRENLCVPIACTDWTVCESGEACIGGFCATSECSGNYQCAAHGTDQVCRDGDCVAVPCTDWTVCESGEACIDGFCATSECTTTYNCYASGTDQVCRDGACVTMACSDWTGCESGEGCLNDKCVYGECPCSAPYTCRQNLCVQASCIIVEDCEGTETCNDDSLCY